jgi:hypothetical protein
LSAAPADSPGRCWLESSPTGSPPSAGGHLSHLPRRRCENFRVDARHLQAPVQLQQLAVASASTSSSAAPTSSNQTASAAGFGVPSTAPRVIPVPPGVPGTLPPPLGFPLLATGAASGRTQMCRAMLGPSFEGASCNDKYLDLRAVTAPSRQQAFKTRYGGG